MQLLFISTADALYPAELELRYGVLREPLGFRRSDVSFPFEEESLHLVAVEDGAVVACVLFHMEDESSGRLFQMAVASARQGQGLGRRMVRELEAEVRRRGVREVVLHSRENAVPFYQRLGYAIDGEPFMEVGIRHRKMRKMLEVLDR